MVKRLSSYAVAALATVLLAPAALATTVVRLSDAQLVAGSELIVAGEVIDSRSQWIGRDLVTFATVRVTDRIKGEAGNTVQVVLPGGIDADRQVPLAVTWPGQPRLGLNEEVFLFLDRDAAVAGTPVIAGFAQGKFSVVTDRAGRRTVTRDLGGISLVDAEHRPVHGNVVRSESLDDFTARIRTMARVQRGDR